MKKRKLKEKLTEISDNDNSELRREIAFTILSMSGDGQGIESFIEDLTKHGCVSGMVGNLVYYHDTVKFHDHFEEEIWTYIYDNLQSENILQFLADLNGAEHVASMTQFKNLLSWYAFEAISFDIGREIGLDI